jgi:hypothetical protein
MNFTVKKRFTFVVDSVKLTHLLGIYPNIKKPYWYKDDGSVEFAMNEEDAENLVKAIFEKYADEHYDYLEGMDLESMNLANELDDNLNNVFWDN